MSNVRYEEEALQEMCDIVHSCPHRGCGVCAFFRDVLAKHAPTLIPTDAQAQSSGALKR